MNRRFFSPIFAGIIITLTSTGFVGGVVFARTADTRMVRLEETTSDHATKLDKMSQKLAAYEERQRRMEKMLVFLSAKAGYAPAEMGGHE